MRRPYASIKGHQSMVFDDNRNQEYLSAMKRVVGPDSVVLDLGAGLGIHGLLAARLGARKVYMVEPSPVINIARMLVEKNGLQDQIECIRGTIQRVDLPEKVDVIISVFTGNFLLIEDLLPSLFYARDQFLREGGHLIPSAGVMIASPVSIPDFHTEQLARWSEPYHGLDMEPGRRFVANSLFSSRRVLKGHKFLAPPSEIMALDFQNDSDTNCDVSFSFEITEDGQCHGLCGWFKIKLGERWLSTGPNDPLVHWTPVLLPLDPPMALSKGETLDARLKRPPNGDWTWTITTKNSCQTHSTFYSRYLSVNTGPPSTPKDPPILTPRTVVIQSALRYFDGETSIEQVVDRVLEELPNSGLQKAQIRGIVESLAR